jgi:hypothetical protein
MSATWTFLLPFKTGVDSDESTPLIAQTVKGRATFVARLLQDAEGRATVNMQLEEGFTALHNACHLSSEKKEEAQKIELLLGAGADTIISVLYGWTAEDILHGKLPKCKKALALFAQVPDSRRVAHARRLVATSSHGLPLTQQAAKARDGQGAALRRVELTPLAAVLEDEEEEEEEDDAEEDEAEEGWEEEEEEEQEEGGGSSAGSAAAAAVGDEGRRDKRRKEMEEARKLCILMAFVLGLGVGVEGRALPRLPGGVFVLIMTMLMPRWDPLRKGLKGGE